MRVLKVNVPVNLGGRRANRVRTGGRKTSRGIEGRMEDATALKDYNFKCRPPNV